MRFVWLALGYLGCVPVSEDRPSRVDSPRVLAVVIDPPEARPGETVAARVIVGDASGVVADPQAYWALCTSTKDVAENNAVDVACWDERYAPLGGPAETIEVSIPDDACSTFGPEVTDDDQRPTDADSTGGYYLPVRVAIPELAAFGFARLTCRLPNASADVVADFEEAHTPNRNPLIERLEVTDESGLPAGPTVLAGSRLSLRVSTASDSVERYPLYVQAAGAVELREEALRVAWFSNAALLDREVSRVESSRGEAVAVADVPGPVAIWAIVRDDRGGAAVAVWSGEIVEP